jgi:hypothetical protein
MTFNFFAWSQLSDTSIILDSSEYIKELKQKVVRLKQEIACEEAGALNHNSSPTTVSVRAYIIGYLMTFIRSSSRFGSINAGHRGNPRARVRRQRVL